MTTRRYPNYPNEVNDLLDFAREVRRFERLYPEDVNSPDIIQHVSDFAANWGWDLLDIVLDHEERVGDEGLPPEPVKRKAKNRR